MTRALILVDHGSRAPEAHAHLERLAAQVRRRAPGMQVEVAHMELAAPTLDEAVATVVERGARQLLIHPLFLAPGRHLQQDIPRIVEQVRAKHPELDVRQLPALGEQSEIIDVILAAVLGSLVE